MATGPGSPRRSAARAMQLGAIAHILLLLVGAVAGLVIGIFLPRARQIWTAAGLGLVVLAAAAVAVDQLDAPPGLVFHDGFVVDRPFLWTMLVVLAAAAMVGAMALRPFRRDQREAEFYVMLLFSTLGAIMLAGAHDVMEIVMGVLLTSVASYALTAWRRADRLALEALLKFYLFGALTNTGLILGLVLLYGLTGSTLIEGVASGLGPEQRPLFALALVLVVLGLGFKAGFVPGHFWMPDTYQGTTLPVAAWLSVAPKVAAVLALGRLVRELPVELFDWRLFIALVSAVTMSWGNVAALAQRDLRRMLAYSTVAQTGYMMMAVAVLDPAGGGAMQALLFYFLAYLFANIAAFAVLQAVGRTAREDLAGLVRARPGMSLALAVALLSLTGLPPLAGFVGKFLVFVAAAEGGFYWLAALAVANSALSLIYYLWVIAAGLKPDSDATFAHDPGAAAVAWLCTAATLVAGLAPFLVLG